MFETASRVKLRFSYNGLVSVEDLWDIPLEHLDKMFKALNKELNDSKEESLLATKKSGSDMLALRTDIIKHVVKTRLEEEEKRKNRAAQAVMLKDLKQALAKQEANAIDSMSKEDLLKRIEEISRELNNGN